jgi:hypothetical protein
VGRSLPSTKEAMGALHECLRPSGSPLGVQSVVIFQGQQNADWHSSLCAWPRTLFHILPPLVECRVLSCNGPMSNSITLRKFHGLRLNRRVDQMTSA